MADVHADAGRYADALAAATAALAITEDSGDRRSRSEALNILGTLEALHGQPGGRRPTARLTAFASGLLLLCDAWFDAMTAAPPDVWRSLGSAALEIPIAALLIGGALRLVHFMAARFWLLPPGMHLWQVPLAIPELTPSKPLP